MFDELYCAEYEISSKEDIVDNDQSVTQYTLDLGFYASTAPNETSISVDTVQDLLDGGATIENFPAAYNPEYTKIAPGSWVYCVKSSSLYVYDVTNSFEQQDA